MHQDDVPMPSPAQGEQRQGGLSKMVNPTAPWPCESRKGTELDEHPSENTSQMMQMPKATLVKK